VDNKRQRGASAEADAAQLLIASGYHIVERNFRCRFGELDLVARDGDVLVFVEVRSRADDEHGAAVLAVGPAKQRQVARVAAFYIAAVQPAFAECRFDIVAITGGDPVVMKDAFRAGVRAQKTRR
jgi:putative endonuclease